MVWLLVGWFGTDDGGIDRKRTRKTLRTETTTSLIIGTEVANRIVMWWFVSSP